MIAALIATIGGALAFIATRPGGERAVAGERVVLAFGDSVAAGQGLGPALGYPNNDEAFPARVGKALGWPVFNFAISSACAATAATPDAHPDTPAACTVSVLDDQLDRARQEFTGIPRVILLTVGANDIRFAECGLNAIVPDLFDDVCDDETFGAHLAALEANLVRVLGRLAERYPGAEILLTAYYNPMPVPAGAGGEPCPIYEPLAAVRSPLSLVSDRVLRGAALELQAGVYAKFREGVTALNEAIGRAAVRAGAAVAAVDFSGHDLCVSKASPPDVAWVYGPDYDVRFRVQGAAALLADGKTWQGTLPSRCPQPTPGEPPEFSTGERERRVGVITVRYSARVNVNCMPHPTAEGQQAIAEAIMAALPDGLR